MVTGWSAVELDSALLHLARGLRPMQKIKEAGAYELVGRTCFFDFLLTAHCLRGHHPAGRPASYAAGHCGHNPGCIGEISLFHQPGYGKKYGKI